MIFSPMSKEMLKKLIILFTIMGLLLSPGFFGAPSVSSTAYAEELVKETERYAGSSRYLTAIEISKNNWYEAYTVVLARGDAFPDALAGALLANSPAVGGPLLLTESKNLRSDVLAELKRLNTSTVYILGGTGAISESVENALKSNNIQVIRIEGFDRYATAANISTTAIPSSTKAFLVSGETFADALSISSYAAAQGVPLLLTEKDELPEATIHALQTLGVTDITLIGGEGAISQTVEDQLKSSNYNVERISGADRFQTNINIIKHYHLNPEKVIIATGMSFPDALAGSVLAAKNNHPIVLMPQVSSRIPGSTTALYLEENRPAVNSFLILGGSAAVNYKIEFFIRNGKFNPRLSLQFWDGHGSKAAYERILSYVPGNLTDHIHILSPNFTGELRSDGSFGYNFPSSSVPQYLVALGQSKGAKVVPMMLADGKDGANAMLLDAAKRKRYADSVVKLVQETNADGILIDLEALADNTQQGLTSLMQDIYGRLNPQGKIVMISVMSRTSRTAEPWYNEYNYRALGQYADYVQIMSYDFSYSSSAPGPIAPLDWVRKVMTYAVTEIPAEKILMGVPYYGRSWKYVGGRWQSESLGWAEATSIAAQYGAAITRKTTPTDPIGVPTFKYVDSYGYQRTVYYDDNLSWAAKLDLIELYDLGGVGGWSMSWVNEVSSSELYPLLKDRT